MKIDIKEFRVKSEEKIDLKKWPTKIKPFYESEKEAKDSLAKNIEDLKDLHEKLYAGNEYSLLIIFQAMDAAGKDSAIKHVLSGLNPQGCQVTSFKHPSVQELDHDFFWRTALCLPERGRIGVFNRSYYEEVLIVRVHPDILKSQKLPKENFNKKTIWKERFESINNYEQHLHLNGTKVIKFFLHVSKEEQRQRFLQRIDEADKNWKFSETDIQERKLWKDYMKAYEDMLGATSNPTAPWYVIPADDKPNAQMIISKIVVETLQELKLSYPKISEKRKRELQAMRSQLTK